MQMLNFVTEDLACQLKLHFLIEDYKFPVVVLDSLCEHPLKPAENGFSKKGGWNLLTHTLLQRML